LSETRERILDAAATVVRERGLSRATTKEIARAAGLSEAALYRHFTDKVDLFVKVLDERLPGLIAAMKDLPARVGTGTVAATLEEIAAVALAFYAQMAPMTGSLFSEPDLLARHQASLREQGLGPHLAITALAGYLREEQKLGRLPAGVDPEAGAALLLGACFQRAFNAQFLGSAAVVREDTRFVKKLVSTLLRS
jgi:AcrR family transcriptional regulator